MTILELEQAKLGTMTRTRDIVQEALSESTTWLQTEEVVTARKRLQAKLNTLQTMINEQNKLISELQEREVKPCLAVQQ